MLVFALMMLACQEPKGNPPAVDAGDLPEASAPAPVCSTATTRCVNERTVERCNEQGSGWEATACPADEPCVAGGCTSLVDPLTDRRVSDLYRFHGAGWVNAWASYGPVSEKDLAKLLAEPSGPFAPHAGSKPLCRPDGWVRVHKRRYGKGQPTRHQLLTGYVVTARGRPVVLKLGSEGPTRVWVGGKLVVERNVQARYRAFQDEVVVPVTLNAGVTPIAVTIVQKKGRETGMWLRFAEEDGRPARDLLWSPGQDQRCGLEEMVDIQRVVTPIAGGFSVQSELALRGVAPPGSYDFRWWQGGDVKKATERGSGSVASARQRDVIGLPFVARKRSAYGLTLTGSTERIVNWPVVYRGKLHERIVTLDALARSLPPVPERSESSFRHAVTTLMEALADNHSDLSWLEQRAKRLETFAEALRAGRDPYRDATGIVYRAYRSALDGQLQPYVVYIPPRHDRAGTPLPLVVAFHGLGQEPGLALRTVVGMAPDDNDDRGWATRHLPRLPDLGAIIVAPWGYDTAGQRQLGEHDVLAIVEHMKSDYQVDPARVSLTGYSLGGTVAFVVPLHYPDRFAAAAPLCGYPNLTSWQSIKDTPKQPFEETMIARRYIGNYVDNGLHLPLHIVHGGRDGPHRSAGIAKRYKALGYPRVFDIQPELDHNVWDYGYKDGRMIQWLRRRTIPDHPDHVHLRSAEYRYDRAYWVRLIAKRDPNGFADIDARFEAGVFTVTTDNVTAFAIDVRGFDANRAVVDGHDIELDREAVFVKSGDTFALGPEPARNKAKRAGISGPLDDALRHPLVVVYGTQDPAQTATNRLVAQHYASYDQWAAAEYPVVADTDARVAGTSVVLIGGPSSNSLTAKWIDRLPVSFESDAIVMAGRRYEGADVGVSLIYPHPEDAEQYVVLHGGVTFRGTLYSRHLPRLAPDFLIYDAGINNARGGELLDDRTVLEGGFFDDDWGLSAR